MTVSTSSFNFGLLEVEKQIRYCAGRYNHASPFINQNLVNRVEKATQNSFPSILTTLRKSVGYTTDCMLNICMVYPFLDPTLRNRFLNPSLLRLIENSSFFVKELTFCKPLNFFLKCGFLSMGYSEMILFELVGAVNEKAQLEEIISKTINTPYESLLLNMFLDAKKDNVFIERSLDGNSYFFKPIFDLTNIKKISDSICKTLKDFTDLFPDCIQKRIKFISELDYRYLVLRIYNYLSTVLETFNKAYEHPYFWPIFVGSCSLVFFYHFFTHPSLTNEAHHLLEKRIKTMADFLILKKNELKKTLVEQKYLRDLAKGILENEEALVGELMTLRKIGINYYQAKALLKPLLAASKEIIYA